MADFTARLPLTEGTNRVIDDPATPSFVGAALDFARSALEGYSQIKQDVSRSNAAKAAAEEKKTRSAIDYDVSGVPAAAVQEVATSGQKAGAANSYLENLIDKEPTGALEAHANSFGTLGEDGVFTNPTVVDPTMEREVTRSGQQAMSIVTAVEQGRMPAISINSAVTSRFRALREKYPEHTGYLIDTWKKMGLDKNTSPELADAADWHEFGRESEQNAIEDQRKREEVAITAATTAYGPDAIGMSREDLIVAGMTIQKRAYTLDTLEQEGRIKLGNATLTDKQKDALKSDLNQGIKTQFSQMVYEDAVPFIRTITNLASNLLKNGSPEALIEFRNQGVRANQMIPNFINAAVQKAQSAGYTGDVNELRAELTAQFGPITQLFTGDHSVIQASADALGIIERAAKVNTAEALQVMTGLQGMGVKVAEMPGFMAAIDGNADLQRRLRDEIKGYVVDWGKDRASTRIVDIVKILRGDKTLSEMDPTEQRLNIPGLVNSTRELAKGYTRGLGVDGNKVINGVGELAMASRVINPTSDPDLLYNATKGFASPTTRDALVKALSDPNVNKDMTLATVTASRAASAHLLNSVLPMGMKLNDTSRYFRVRWDEKNGRAYLDNTLHVRAVAQARRMGSGVGKPGNEDKFSRLGKTVVNADQLAKQRPPQEMVRFIEAVNTNVSNALELGKHDPSTPKATNVQLANWYVNGTPLPNEGGTGPGAKPVDVAKELDTQFDALDAMIDSGFANRFKPSTGPATDYTAIPEYKTVAPVLQAAAAKYSVPEKLAVALVGKESSFNPNAQGPVIKSGTHKGDRAMGLGQVMAKTAAAYGIHNRASLDPAGQADLAMRVLSDNYKKSGNWRDAVSMYFTGVPYAKAVSQGRSDGFNSVMQYVEDIL